MVTLKFYSLQEVKIGDVIDYRKKSCKRKNLMTVISVKDGTIKLEYERQIYRKSIEERVEITAQSKIGEIINIIERDMTNYSRVFKSSDWLVKHICYPLWERKAALERV